ncbi:Kinesin-like protein KIN-14C [Linum grandiflorum]
MMASRNQNRPPRSPAAKRDGGDGVSVDKRRRVGVGAGRTGGPDRRPLSSVNKKLEGASSTVASEVSEGGVTEFTKEEVEALANERPKMKKFDHKGNLEVMTEFNGRLKICIRWCQKQEEKHVEEESRLRSALEASEKRCADIEAEMRCKEETYRTSMAELSKENASLQEKLSKEGSEKLAAIESHRKEHEARIRLETVQASLSKDLEKAHQDISVANQRAAVLAADYKRSQEYNQNLQQHISKVLADLNAERESLKRVEKDKSAIVERLSALRGDNHSLEEQLTISKTSRDEAVSQKNNLENELKGVRGDLQQARDDRDRQLAQVQALTAELLKYQENSGKLFAEIDVVTEKTKSLEETCSSQRQHISLLEQKLSAANEKLKILDLSAGETRTEYDKQTRIVRDLQDRLADAEHKLLEGEKLRKKLHNTILELKGNIRVFCRVRPVLPDESCTQVISYPDALESLGRGIDVIQNGQKYPFTFDKVFSNDASQQDVFVEISQLVQSALDGYKVCIFAYGQTGSGKTYTMMGKPEAPDLKGLIPRSLEQVFEASQSLMAQGWKYKMQASMLEIYNETIRDLLSPNSSSSTDTKQYKIQHDTSGNTHVTDLTVVDVSSLSEVSSLLRKAAQSRSVGKTNMNEQSSRSHFVFTLRIYGVNEGTDQQLQGVLNLIDLAGSERLSKSGATGDRLKETQAINKSLSCLANVIFSLAKKEDHVPFRDSKLTHLLQPCLGGESKTLMFVNVSPDPSSVGESLCSLKFAARVNACEIGVARRQMNLKLPAPDSRLSYG